MNQKTRAEIIKAPKLSEILNTKFLPIWKSTDRFNILWGGRGSSKSDFVAYKILFKMINDNYFKGVAIFKIKENIEKNLWQTVLKVIERYNLMPLFDFKRSPFTITCKQNQNILYFGGLSDPSSYRGISDLTFCWFEEAPCETERDWADISLTMRGPNNVNLEEWYTLNPVIENYEEHWFYKKFFEGETELSFRKKIEVVNEKGEIYYQDATILHSNMYDNRFLNEQTKAGIEMLAKSSPYLFQVYKLGIWANKIIEGRYYNKFDPGIHVKNKAYNPDKTLHCSWDFNRRPYSALIIFQVYEKTVHIIDEICIYSEESDASTLEQSTNKLKQRYSNHTQGIYVYGDPSGRAEQTDTKPGYNYFMRILEELKQYNPTLRVQSKAPLQKTSGEFINSIFQHEYSGIQIFVDEKCKELIKDLLYMKMNGNGDIEVEYTKNEDGVKKIEKYGHAGAAFRYFMISYFNEDYQLHMNPSTFTKGLMGSTRQNMVRNKKAW
jgi:PBSX family phage terminase large subunit